MDPVFAYAHLNIRILPFDRGEQFEDPLMEALESNGYGEVTGAGTMQAESGEIEYCGIDIDLHDLQQGVPFICNFLTERGAPKGSKLTYEHNGQSYEVPFGNLEGIALYLNGSDLPDEVYRNCDINLVIEEINNRIQDGGIRSYWEGPTETALYLYGDSAQEMWNCIAPFIAQYPLCQKSRAVQIA